MVISSIYLSQGAYTVPPVIHAVQGDTGRILWMYLTDTDLSSEYDSPYTAGLYFKRSDGTYYNEECMTDSTYNRCEAALDQALTQPGVTKCQLKIEDAAGICSTFDFNIIVHESTSGVSEEQLGYSLEEIREIIAGAKNSGLTAEVKQALMDIVNHVAWAEDVPTGKTYIDALETALYPPVSLESISAVYTQSGTVYDTDTLDDLKTDLVVTAHYDDSTTEIITNYALSGTLVEGISEITVMYGGKTTTFNVTVSSKTRYIIQNVTGTGANATYEIDDLDFANGDYIEVSITPSSNNDAFFRLGTDDTQGNLFVYNNETKFLVYGSSSSITEVTATYNPTNKTNASYRRCQNVTNPATSNPVIIVLNSNGLYINNVLFTSVTGSWTGSTSLYTNALSELTGRSTLYFGVNGANTATVNYVKVVKE